MYFLLLVLGISFNLNSDAGYEQGRFFKTLPENGLELVLSRRSAVIFDLSFIPLSAEIILVVEEQSRKRNTFRAHSTGRIKMIFVLLTDIIKFYI